MIEQRKRDILAFLRFCESAGIALCSTRRHTTSCNGTWYLSAKDDSVTALVTEWSKSDDPANDIEEVVSAIRAAQGDQTLTAFANSLSPRVSASYISEIYNGSRKPGPKILKALNIDKPKRWR